MINIEDEYRGLLSAVLHGGTPKEDRTGTGTKAVFGRMLRHDMELGFPILTGKKIYFKNAVTELLWILQGRTDLNYLNSHGVKYWNPDYERSGRYDGTLGPVYGKQWRNFGGVDQLRELICNIKKDPYSRRHIVSAWNPFELADMALPPCHYCFQVYINDGKLSLMWQQRSADLFLGLPYDFVMYGLFLELLCEGLKYKPGQLICSLGDCHLYNNHVEQAKEYLSRETYDLPTVDIKFGLDIKEGAGNFLMIPTHNMIELKNYKCNEPIKAQLSVG